MRVGIVGAGVSGLVAARVLAECGHDVVVWDGTEDLGGVWSSSRRYPGIGLQNDKVTYGFSDFAMPEAAPEFPDGDTVRRWLVAYADRFALTGRLRLGTRVLDADQEPDGDWTVTVAGEEGTSIERVDWLVMANGIFSRSHLPAWPGRAEFAAAGGRVVVPSEVGDGEMLRGRDVAVVGWGKSACDLATVTSRLATSTTVIARTVRWKIPRRMGRITFGHVLLTRLGEHLLWGSYRSRAGRALRVGTRIPRSLAVRRLRLALEEHVPLHRLGLSPRTGATDIDSLVTDGFFEAVDAGRIVVRGHTGISALTGADGRPGATLLDGTAIAADVVVAATGYDQDTGPLSSQVRARLLETSGVLRLRRAILPERVDRLAYIGWMHSFRSPIGAEIQSLWLAAMMAGMVRLPSRPWREDAVESFWLTREQAAAHGAAQIPKNASILDLDQLIEDFSGRVPFSTRLQELTRPLDPAAYGHLLPRLVTKISERTRREGRSIEARESAR